MLSLFDDLKTSNTTPLLEVAADDVGILLPDSAHIAIGTQGLNGCACVVILGTAIILAHILPLPGEPRHLSDTSFNLLQPAMAHHDRFLDRIKNMIAENVAHFPPATTAWGIFSYGHDGPVRSVKNIVQRRLTEMGYQMRPSYYRSITWEVVPPKGQVVALRNRGTTELYVERTRVWPQPTGINAEPPGSEQTPVGEACSNDRGPLLTYAQTQIDTGASAHLVLPQLAQSSGATINEALEQLEIEAGRKSSSDNVSNQSSSANWVWDPIHQGYKYWNGQQWIWQ